MIHVDVEGFMVHVPLKPRMTAEEFLAIADKLAQVTGHPVHHEMYEAPVHQAEYTPPAPQPVLQSLPQEWQQPEPVQRQYTPPMPAAEPMPQYIPPQPITPQYGARQTMMQQAPSPLPLPEPEPVQDLRFDKEDELRMQHMFNQIRSQMGQIKNTEDRLDKHEQHLKQILSYLHSLDKHLRK